MGHTVRNERNSKSLKLPISFDGDLNREFRTNPRNPLFFRKIFVIFDAFLTNFLAPFSVPTSMCQAARAAPILMTLHIPATHCGAPTGICLPLGFVTRTAASRGGENRPFFPVFPDFFGFLTPFLTPFFRFSSVRLEKVNQIAKYTPKTKRSPRIRPDALVLEFFSRHVVQLFRPGLGPSKGVPGTGRGQPTAVAGDPPISKSDMVQPSGFGPCQMCCIPALGLTFVFRTFPGRQGVP